MKRLSTIYFEPLVAGCFYAWGFPLKGFPSFFLAPMLAIFLLCYRLTLLSPKVSERNWKKDLGRVLLFSLGAWLLGYSWIPETLRIFGEIIFPLNYLVGSLSTVLILPQFFTFLILVAVLNALHKRFGLKFFYHPILMALFFVFLEEFTPQLFPTHLGHSWLQLAPYLGLAPYAGVPLFSFFSFWLIFEVMAMVREKKLFKSRLILVFSFFALFILGNVLFPLKYTPTEGQSLELRLAQVNIESYLKLASEKGSTKAVKEVFSKYVELSMSPRSKRMDLLIWPETAYPYTIDSKLWLDGKNLPPLFLQIGEYTRADMVWGGYEWGAPANPDDFETTYNSAIHFAHDPEKGMVFKGSYRKMRLIPFGETLPFGPLNPWLGEIIKNISYFKKGEKFELFTTKKDKTFISAICYEILFSSFVRDYLKSVSRPPHFLINLTNDSWYGDTNEPLQHLFLAKWRALEFDLPIVRSTNSGISAIIYPDGSEEARLPYGVKEKLDAELKLKDRTPTLYERFGLMITIVVALILFGLAIGLEKSLRAKGHANE